MILQTNNKLDNHINKSGCYFMSLLTICEIESKLALCTNTINNIYSTAIGREIIDEVCTVKKPDELLKLGFNALSSEISIYQIGVIEKGQFIYWNWVKDKSYDWMVIEHKTPGTFGQHFLLADVKQHIFYDPLGGAGWRSEGIKKIVLYHKDK